MVISYAIERCKRNPCYQLRSISGVWDMPELESLNFIVIYPKSGLGLGLLVLLLRGFFLFLQLISRPDDSSKQHYETHDQDISPNTTFNVLTPIMTKS